MVSTTRIELSIDGRTSDGSPAIIALNQLCTHVNRYYFALFGSGQLLPHINNFCTFTIRSFISAVALVKSCNESIQKMLAQDLQIIENTIATLNADFQSHIR